MMLFGRSYLEGDAGMLYLRNRKGGNMTTFICFAIAMAILYIMQVFSGGFDFEELLSFIIMMALLGGHVYLSTRRKVFLGGVIPTLLILSFYPVCKMINPVGSQLFILIGGYLVAIGCCLYIWYKARKDNRKRNDKV